MNRLFTFIISILFFLSQEIVAQTTPAPPNAAGTSATGSPAANAFNRANQIPVNHYSGIPQITIPFFSFSGNNLQHSVGLSYFSGGVKVEEIAGNTGLGWSLMAGGAITRTVQGLPDDNPGTGWLSMSPISLPSGDQFTSHTNGSTPPNADQFYVDAADSHWDIFQFNVNGLSGKFYLGKDQTVTVAPLQKLKVQYQINSSLNVTTGFPPGFQSSSTIESFTITDPTGVRYIFSEREVTGMEAINGQSGLYNRAYVSAWYLSSIISPFNEDTISITYQNVTTSRATITPASFFDCLTCSGTQNDIWGNPNTITSYTAGKRIKAIYFPDKTWIDFVYDVNPRCDLAGEHALREVNIRDTALRSGFKLEYLYYSSKGDVGYSGCNNVLQDHRLQLKMITPYTPLANSPSYIFNYNQAENLPPLRSMAQDHWGNHNGQRSNTSLTPTELGLTGGANRTPDPHFASAGILTGIQYPTGGSATLEYEQNERYTIIPVLQAANVGLSNSTSQSHSFQKLLWQFPTRFNFELTSTGGASWYNEPMPPCVLNITITPMAGSTVNGAAQHLGMTLTSARNGFIRDYLFPQGTTHVQINWSYTNCSDPSRRYAVRISWVNETGPAANGTTSFTGGVRIKRISEFDRINVKPISVREFRYTNLSGQSSGFVNSTPEYTNTLNTETQVSPGGGFFQSSYRVHNPAPVNFQHYTQGSPVGYSRVEEFFGTIENNLGRQVYEFSSYTDSIFIAAMNQRIPPYISEQIAEWMLGLPVRTQLYSADNRLLTETINEYNHQQLSLQNNNHYRGIRLSVVTERYNFNSTTPFRLFKETPVFPVTGLPLLTKTVEINYRNNDTLRSETLYEYNLQHYVPVKTITRTNKKAGQEIEAFTYYPFHYTGIHSGPLQTLKTSDIMLPVSSETWLKDASGSRLLNASINDFQTVNVNQIRPFSQFELEADAPVPFAVIGAFNPSILNRNTALIKSQSEQTVFNSKGIAVETRDVKTNRYNSVILDYDNQIPSAKAANARYSEIAYTSFETAGTGNWNYSGTSSPDPVRSVMGKRFYNLSSGAITKNNIPSGKNYILSLWSRSGTVNVSGATLVKTESNAVTNWVYNEYQLSGGNAVTISGTAQLDELRLYPVGAVMVTENIEPMVGTISSCNENNKIVYQEYDVFNRPRLQRDQDMNIIKANEYHFISNSTVNRESVWQDVTPLTTQCEKHGTTQYNTGVQLKLQRDINPSSFSYMAQRWVSNGSNTSACPIVPDWQDTGLRECVMNGATRTGEERKQERDMNPVSTTYNQTRWVSMGVTGNCPPVTIRATIEIRNMQFHYYSNGSYYTGDVFIVLRDANTNQPINANNLIVDYSENSNSNGNIFSQNHSILMNGVSEIAIFSGTLNDSYTDPWGGWSYFYDLGFSILPGTGYIL